MICEEQILWKNDDVEFYSRLSFINKEGFIKKGGKHTICAHFVILFPHEYGFNILDSYEILNSMSFKILDDYFWGL